MKDPQEMVGQDVMIGNKKHHIHSCIFPNPKAEQPIRLIECTREGFKDKVFLVLFSKDGKNYEVLKLEPESIIPARTRKKGRGVYFS